MDAPQTLFSFGPREIFTFFFIMLGPIKLLAPYARITAGCTPAQRRNMALQSAAIATATVLAASFIGCSMLEKWNVSPGALAIAGGILFFSVAFAMVMQPYTDDAAAAHEPPPANMATVMRRVVPAIVSPHGIAAVILILTLTQGNTVPVVVTLVGIMLLDLLAMLFARPILKVVAFPLQIVGTVMGVLQVALSVQMVIYGVHMVAVKFGLLT